MPRGGGFLSKKSFTLSEVLITLVVIGIAAAITVPQIIVSYRNKTLESQFKKSYANIENAINFVNAQNGTPYECYTVGFGNYYPSECNSFWSEVLSRFNITKICESNDRTCHPLYKTKEQVLAQGGKVMNNSCTHPINTMKGIVLNDGSIIYLHYYGNVISGHMALYFGLDVNGVKGPNKWGYDLFYLNLHKKKNSSVVAMTAVCELIEKGGQSAESILTK